jgi:hypothetical protein
MKKSAGLFYVAMIVTLTGCYNVVMIRIGSPNRNVPTPEIKCSTLPNPAEAKACEDKQRKAKTP